MIPPIASRYTPSSISIPCGTIRRFRADLEAAKLTEFQFLVVRLEDEKSTCRVVVTTFQFLVVRLEDYSLYCAET